MKIGRKALVILGGGVLLTSFIILNMMRNEQATEQNKLQEELAIAQRALGSTQNKQLAARKADLEQRLNQQVATLKSIQQQLSPDIASIDSTEMIFTIAGSANVEITEITSNGFAKGELEGIPCSVLPLTIRAEGDVPNLIDFVYQLTASFPTGVVSTADIDVPEVIEDESTAGGETGGEAESGEPPAEQREKPEAKIQFTIYAYQRG
jgi:hypothetical protein